MKPVYSIKLTPLASLPLASYTALNTAWRGAGGTGWDRYTAGCCSKLSRRGPLNLIRLVPA